MQKILEKIDLFLGDNLRLTGVILFILFLKWPGYIFCLAGVAVLIFSFLETN